MDLSIIQFLDAGRMGEISTFFEYPHPGRIGCTVEEERVVCPPVVDQLEDAVHVGRSSAGVVQD